MSNMMALLLITAAHGSAAGVLPNRISHGNVQSGRASFRCPHQSRHELVWEAQPEGGFRARDSPEALRVARLPADCEPVEVLPERKGPVAFLQMKTQKHETLESRLPLVPYPAFVEKHPGTQPFRFEGARLMRGATVPENDIAVRELAAHLGWSGPPPGQDNYTKGGSILLEVDETMPADSYHIHVTEKNVTLHGPSLAPLFYAVQTFKQLSPKGALEVPALIIKDRPRFGWRGLHIDVSRHFFAAAEIKKMVDVMAMFKLNRLHWHLTDDQGWRLPIDGYPKLTEIGSESVDGKRQSYTLDEIRDVVAYAKERHIEIMPEIDNPGHAEAAIVAYPELGNSDSVSFVQPQKPMKKWGVSQYTLSPNEASMKFLETVFHQTAELFPFGFVHIGGDEADSTQWRLSSFAQDRARKQGLRDVQSLFTKSVSEMLRKGNKTMVGWDEVQHRAGLPKDAVVMAWRGLHELELAVRRGHRVINANMGTYYFDWRQGYNSEPQAQPGYLPLHKTYDEDVVPDSLAQHEDMILGAQGQLWTEYISTPSHMQYMAFPRAIALAERVWTPKPSIVGFREFRGRLEARLGDLDALNVNYRRVQDDP